MVSQGRPSHLLYRTVTRTSQRWDTGMCRAGREEERAAAKKAVGAITRASRPPHLTATLQSSLLQRYNPTAKARGGEGGARARRRSRRACRRTCTPQYGWVAAPRTATSDERRRRLGGPAARPGGRVREPRDHRLAAPAGHPRAARQPCREAGDESACQCIVEFRARRAPRQPAPRTSGRAARLPAPSSPSIAAGQRASSRPRCDSVAVVPPKLGARRPICTWWAIHAADVRRPRGTGSVFGTNSRATRRAGE